MKSVKIVAVLLMLTTFASAQDRDRYSPNNDNSNPQYPTPAYTYQPATKGFSVQKIFVGGDLGFGFGSYNTYVDVSPLAGYRFNKWLAAGVKLNFNFASQKSYTDPTQNESYTILGGGVFGRIYPLRWLYLQVEPEYNVYSANIKSSGTVLASETHDVVSLLIGGGYVQQISSKAAITFGIMYDVLQNEYSPYYGIPVFQGGININL
jgi:hypothetical protein